MAADTSSVQQLEAPPLKPLNFKSKLASTPNAKPKYWRTLKNAAGKEVVVAEPNATGALEALRDVHAVIGGAACYWGGTAADGVLMEAGHGIMVCVQGV